MRRYWNHRGHTRYGVGAGLAIGIASLMVAATAGAAAAPKTIRHSGSSVTINGAGSTFDQPFFTSAFYDYNQTNPNITINYASIGSGGGEAQFEANTVNFGASDVPMLATDLASVKPGLGPVLQIPVDLGGEAISYHLAGVPTALHMTGPVLAKIFLGAITNWDNKQIKALNPKVKFPNQAITIAHRADGSGTTYIFSNYMSEVSAQWLTQVGTGKSLSWPVGVGGQGNEGVAGIIADTPGSIGYVELDYAAANHFKYFAMENSAKQFVLPDRTSVRDEAALKPNVTAQNFSITDLPATKKNLKIASKSYPISGYSWGLIYEDQTNATTGGALVNMFYWLTHKGQNVAGGLGYVPLPTNVQQLAQKTLAKAVGPGGTALLTATS